jgi:hypothetical protein
VDGQALIYENGGLMGQSERFSAREELILADIDVDRIVADRTSISSYADSTHDHIERLRRMRHIEFDLVTPAEPHPEPLRRRSNASRTSRPIPRAGASATRRSTTSRSRGSRSACARQGSRRS